MSSSARSTPERTGRPDHGFHSLRVSRAVVETPEARTLVLDVPKELRETYRYASGQFCTFRTSIDGQAHLRCYSMSSAPAVDRELQVTIKRVPGGLVSNHLIDSIRAGDLVEATPPAGVFCLAGRGPLLAYAAGSGITPIISLAKEALATSDRKVRLLYANRDQESTIFGAALDDLVRAHPGRIEVVHHLDVVDGYVDGGAVRRTLADDASGAEVYVCGPAPYMDLVEETVRAEEVAAERIHIERFTPAEGGAEGEADPAPADGTRLTIEIDGRTGTTDHYEGTTILQTARQMDLAPPSSCESGSCATCMARLVEGAVTMHVNDALTDDEVDDGWILTCQSVPTSATITVIYGDD